MTETIILATFATALFLCISLDISILAALLFGFFLFFGYGLYRRYSFRKMTTLALSGVKTVKNILITFVLIGMITAVWRAGGTIPFIVYYSTRLCSPRIMVLATFLLCCMISFLTGTAFGTAATIGVICATIANSMGVPILFTGGAVLAGSYFGDRCSPMSTSALLVTSLTGTNLFRNIINMIKTSLVPFFITCIFYALAGLCFEAGRDTSGIQTLFAEHFNLHPITLLPAIVILLFSLFKVNVKITMSISILCSAVICIWLQHLSLQELACTALFGYRPVDSGLTAILSGGGILSMAKVFCIVCLSSCYVGMWRGTGLLDNIRTKLLHLSHKTTSFGGILITSLLTGMISCNQTLTIMLTHQLCSELTEDPEEMASHLENTAVVVAPLIPWSIAGAVTLASVGAPMLCILTACYLYLLPIWNYIVSEHRKHTQRRTL